MPRRVQDIIPGNRRSIRDISVDDSPNKRSVSDIGERSTKKEKKIEEKEEVIKIHREREAPVEYDESNELENKEESDKVAEKHHKRKKRSRFPWIIATLGLVVVLAGVAFAVSGHFATAKFTLVPKTVPVNVSGTYIIPASVQGAFGYEVITLSGVASTTLPAAQGTYTETKAQGSVTIYNNFSAQAQRLVAGTRISGNSGLVYRLTSSVSVPGYKTTAGVTKAGSIVTSIVAEKAGEEYNISRTDSISDFKIVAYKDTSKYSTLYARLVTDVSGGFAGTRMIVSPTLLASTTILIQKNLSADLRTRIAETIPAGYTLYPNVYGSTFDTAKVTSINPQTVSVTAGVTAYGVIFKEIDLARFLSGASSTNLFGSFGYTVPDIENLSVTLSNPKDFSPIKKTNLIVKIHGNFNMVGDIPVTALKQGVAGIPLSATAGVLKKYASVIDIARSDAEINPPWVGTVPTDQNRVTIVIKKQ